MNINRGLFRLWVIFATILIISVSAFNYNDLKIATSHFDPTTARVTLPVECVNARGKPDVDFTQERGYCWYLMPAYRKFYPEYGNLSDEKISDALYASKKAKSTPDSSLLWHALYNILIYGFGISILLLAMGLCIKWIIQGFKNEQR